MTTPGKSPLEQAALLEQKWHWKWKWKTRRWSDQLAQLFIIQTFKVSPEIFSLRQTKTRSRKFLILLTCGLLFIVKVCIGGLYWGLRSDKRKQDNYHYICCRYYNYKLKCPSLHWHSTVRGNSLHVTCNGRCLVKPLYQPWTIISCKDIIFHNYNYIWLNSILIAPMFKKCIIASY